MRDSSDLRLLAPHHPTAPPQGQAAPSCWHRAHLSWDLPVSPRMAPVGASEPRLPACPHLPPGTRVPVLVSRLRLLHRTPPTGPRVASVFTKNTAPLFRVLPLRLCGSERCLCRRILWAAFISAGPRPLSSLMRAVRGYSLRRTFMSQNSIKLSSAWGSRAFRNPGGEGAP